jgi:hypothetical protein
MLHMMIRQNAKHPSLREHCRLIINAAIVESIDDARRKAPTMYGLLQIPRADLRAISIVYDQKPLGSTLLLLHGNWIGAERDRHKRKKSNESQGYLHRMWNLDADSARTRLINARCIFDGAGAMPLLNVRHLYGHNEANTSLAAATVASTSTRPCAAETNAASYCEGGNQTPRSNIPR